MNKKKFVFLFAFLLLGSVAGATVYLDHCVYKIVAKLENMRAQDVEITASVLQEVLDEVAPDNRVVCTEGEVVTCESALGEKITHKKEKVAHILTTGHKLFVKDGLAVGGVLNNFMVFPRPCKINRIRCERIAFELAQLESEYDRPSPEYDQAVRNLFGADLEKWSKLRDGGSRQYMFKDGMIVRHYISELMKRTEKYGAVGISFQDKTTGEWSQEVIIGRNGL
jgi:hypothetical protein